LTKHELADSALKCPLELEEAGKVELGTVGKMLDRNAFAIRGVVAVPKRVPKRKAALTAKASPRVSRLVKVTRKLYDLEPNGEPEKPLKVSLDLYQMEQF
jgi:hypothetical protein